MSASTQAGLRPDGTAESGPAAGSAVRALAAGRAARRRARSVRAGALGLAVVVLFAVSVLLGSYTVTVPDFFSILGGAQIPGASFIVLENKLPRALMAVLVGIGFGMAGTICQTLLRNPLASPDVIGISYGASASAVTAIVLFGASGAAVSFAAVAGGLGVAAAIYLTARRGGLGGYRLILVGIAFAAVLHALVNFLLTRADLRTAAEALVWLTGSLNSSNWDRAVLLGGALVLLVPAALVLSRLLRLLELGDDAAAGLGVRVEVSRAALILTGACLAAVSTAAAGPVAAVAFLCGPIARRLVGGPPSLALAGLVGAVLVLAADFAAANLIPGTSLPVGVLTGALGAPVLLWLLISVNRSGQGG